MTKKPENEPLLGVTCSDKEAEVYDLTQKNYHSKYQEPPGDWLVADYDP